MVSIVAHVCFAIIMVGLMFVAYIIYDDGK